MALRFLTVFVCVACLCAPAARAEDDAALRQTLATRMHAIKPVKTMIDQSIDVMAQQVPEENREKFINAMMLATDYNAVEKASIDSMAKTFTAAELKAMIDYFGSDIAKAAEAKMPDYISGVQQSIQKALDQSVLNAVMREQTTPPGSAAPEAPKTPEKPETFPVDKPKE